ncbi:MAG: hypothetical protein II956_14360 [Bacteroidales bacterium]|nr:hypothetical protein [Bacteroidales bacterium]
MFYTANAEIKIGGVTISGVTDVEIEQSVDTIGGQAKITLPRNMRRKDGKKLLDTIKTGDKVSINLGYNGKLKTEFTGYLAHIVDGTPLVLECDDSWYTFKHAPHVTKSYASVSLKNLLKDLFKGYEIDCVDFTFSGGYIIKDVTPFTVVKKIKEEVGFCTKLDEENKKITCFWAFDFKGFQKHTYVFGTRNGTLLNELRDRKLAPNIAANGLKFVKKEDRKLQITGKAKQKKGKPLTVTVGCQEADAEKRTMNFGSDVTSESELKKRVETELKNKSFDGYEGTVTGFGTPQTKAGDTLKIVDTENPEREGEYLIKRVKLKFNGSGFRRENELSYRIDN